MIVDTHVHVWEMPPVAPIGPTASSFTSLPEEAAPVELLIEDMDANGVDAAVLVQTSWSTWDNTYVAEAASKHPGRLRSIGLIDPLDPGSADLVGHWMDTLGMRGFRFHPDYYPDAEILTSPPAGRILGAIEDRRGIVKVHNRVPNAHQLAGAARRHPGITWIIDHLMYPEPGMAADGWRDYDPVLRLAERENVFLTISDVHSRSDVGFPYRDMHEVIKRGIDAFGIDRCLWGTGYPGHLRVAHGWPPLADELRLVRDGLDWLTAAERASILGGNAKRLYAYGA
ncbi:MAG: amidohydrolase family protein [Spirochaetaceae bacterium]|nr:amidohydrolase family protein [Spirochaetaceae bacterium]